MRVVFHIQGGLGDFYYLLGMAPHIIADRKPDEVVIFIDSIYFYGPQYRWHRDAAIEMMETVTGNWVVFPHRASSFKLHWPSPAVERRGVVQEDIEHDFLFYRREESKAFLRSQLRPDDQIFTAIIGLNHEWRDGRNVPLDYPCDILPLRGTPEYTASRVFSQTGSDSLLIHTRRRGVGMQERTYNKVIAWCHANFVTPVLIGIPHELALPTDDRILDLRGKMSFLSNMWLCAKMPFYFGSSSVYTYHRMFTGKPTIAMGRECLGSYKTIYLPRFIDDPANVFLDADKIQDDAIIRTLEKWYGALEKWDAQ